MDDPKDSLPTGLGDEIHEFRQPVLDAGFQIGIPFRAIGKINHPRTAFYVFHRQKSPIAAVRAVVPIIPHDKAVTGRNDDGSVVIPDKIVITVVLVFGINLVVAVNLVILGNRAAVDMDLLILDLDFFAFLGNDSFYEVFIQFIGVFEHEDIVALEFLSGKYFFFPSINSIGVCKFVYQQKISDQQRRFHAPGGDLKGLNHKGHDEENEDRRFGDQLKIFTKNTFFPFLFFIGHFYPYMNKSLYPKTGKSSSLIIGAQGLLPIGFDVFRWRDYCYFMNFTLFGYPKTGKTTLFNLLTGAGIPIEAYDSGKREPHMRSCPIPDPRLDHLHSLYPEKTKKNTAIDYTDLAGMAFGEVKNAAYMNHLKKADGLTHVVRAFRDEKIPTASNRIDPAGDIRSMEEELRLADLISIESRLEKRAKEALRGVAPDGAREEKLMRNLREHLESGRALREVSLLPSDEKLIRSYAFLSRKPLMHIINIDESDIDRPEKFTIAPGPATSHLLFCLKIETEILELDADERDLFLKEYGLSELSHSRFLKASYDLLNLISFFTIGKEEIKAWPISQGTPALLAAGSVHSDIQQGFIRAEVISLNELLRYGSLQSAKQQGAVRLEGKEYIVCDGDVIYFRFSK